MHFGLLTVIGRIEISESKDLVTIFRLNFLGGGLLMLLLLLLLLLLLFPLIAPVAEDCVAQVVGALEGRSTLEQLLSDKGG